jgi:hypothetical protein
VKFCRGCGRAIESPAPGTPIAYVPCVCGFITVFENNVTSLPLREVIEQASDAATARRLVEDTSDADRCRHVLESAIDLLLQRVQQVAQADPLASGAALWPALVEFDRRSRSVQAGNSDERVPMTTASRVVQVLLAALFELGITPSVATVPQDRVQRFIRQFSSVASSAVAIAPVLDTLRGGLAMARISDGVFEVVKTPLHSRLQEWMLNRQRLERGRTVQPADDVIFSAAAAEAVELWLGFPPAIGRTLFVNQYRILAESAVKKEETVYAVSQGALQGDMRALMQHMTLTKRRAERFAAPFYWDLGIERAPNDGMPLLTRLAVKNWLVYYPVVEGVVNDEPVYFASGQALMYAIAGLEGFKNGMLQRVATAVASDSAVGSVVRTRVNQLRVAANRRFEDYAAEQARHLGFDAVSGLDRIDGQSFEGGEIDLLATRVRDGRLLMVLGEVKDFDVTLHRLGAEAGLRKRIESAEGQLERKAAYVRQHWRRLATLVAGGRMTEDWSEAVFATVLITSAYLPSHLSFKYPAMTMGEFAGFVDEVRAWPEDFGPRFAGAIERLPV